MSDPAPLAVVIGASGGIGSALTEALASRPFRVLALARHPQALRPSGFAAGVTAAAVDVTDESSIAAAAQTAAELGEARLVIVASGLLHDRALQPEKSWRAIDGAAMARVFAVNTIGPALVAKHFLPLLPRTGRSVFAALGARVGSIDDNRSGGWHSYRASKAALAMLIRNLAIELARRAPEAICIGLHPGTVDTPLSQPFSNHVPDGKLFTPGRSAAYLLDVIERARPADSGHVLAWDGSRVPA